MLDNRDILTKIISVIKRIQPSGGTSDYADLTNKPQINSVTLSGNNTLSDLGIAPESMMVTITTEEVQGESVYSSDKTFTQIKDAYEAGQNIFAVQNRWTTTENIFPLTSFTDDTYGFVLFERFDGPYMDTITISSDDSVTIVTREFITNLNCIAPRYDWLSYPIAQGTYCMYDGNLYKAKQAIQTEESFDLSHWDMTTVVDEISAIGT